MPSKSEKQFKFMQTAANDKDFAKENNIKQSVAEEWLEKDLELARVDKKHAKLIGITQKEAEAYLTDPPVPSKETHAPSFEKW